MIKSICLGLAFLVIMPFYNHAQNVISKNQHPSTFGIRQGVSFGINGNGFIGLFLFSDSSCFWKYTASSDSWMKLDNMPAPKGITDASGFSINNNFYVVGGLSSSSQTLRSVYEYNTVNNSWSTKNIFPDSGRAFGIGVSIGNKGYFGLGTTSVSSASGFDRSFYEYNPLSDHWTKVADFPGTGRGYSFVFALNGKAIVGGGLSSNSQYLNDLWEYDPTTDRWTQLNIAMNAFPDGIDGTVGFSIQNNGYLACGILGNSTTFSKVIYTYDATSKDFIEQSQNNLPITSGRGQVCAFALNNKGYIIGGWNSDNISGYKDVYEFSPPITGLNEVKNLQVDVYPNPGSEEITIDLMDYASKATKLEIISLLGATEISLSPNSISKNNKLIIDVRSLTQGIYFLKIESNNETSLRRILIN